MLPAGRDHQLGTELDHASGATEGPALLPKIAPRNPQTEYKINDLPVVIIHGTCPRSLLAIQLEARR
jgi:hypothetical protein